MTGKILHYHTVTNADIKFTIIIQAKVIAKNKGKKNCCYADVDVAMFHRRVTMRTKFKVYQIKRLSGGKFASWCTR